MFRTDRLFVRRWRVTDEADLLALYGMTEVVRWIDDGQPLSASEAAQWMKVTASNYQNRGYGMYAISSVDGTETRGFGGLVHPGNQPDAEVKYALFPAFWGRGFASEFVQGLLRYGKGVHRLTRVVATVAEENLASRQVLIKSGFHQSGMRIESDGARTVVFDIRQ